jgi:hypothetical protein
MPRKMPKLSLNKAAKALTEVAERHLSKLPEEERDSKVAAFSRVNFKKRRGTHSKSSEIERTQVYPVAVRGRE